MMRAKIAVYTAGPGRRVAAVPQESGQPCRAHMATRRRRYLFGNPRAALNKTDALIKVQPKNPYFHELRGDILMRANKPEGGRGCLCPRGQPRSCTNPGILPIAYGQALIAIGKPDALKKAVVRDQQGHRSVTARTLNGYRYLAQAYGQLGDVADAELATAEGHYYSGAYQDAKIFAMRAQHEIQARRAGLGSRPGHHQLQAIWQKEVNLRSRRDTVEQVGPNRQEDREP